MQDKQISKDRRKSSVMHRGTAVTTIIAIFILIPVVIAAAPHMGDRGFYIAGVLIIFLAIVPFVVSFEGRKPDARELVTLAVMSAVAVVSRIAFIMLPQFKPMVGIVMITGISLGPSAGFLTGAVSGFVSNFIMGQGMWTPWQMFAFGLAGFIAGVLGRRGLINPDKRLPVSIVGAAVVMLIVGPILDTCTIFVMSSMIDTSSAAAVYMAGIPFNAVHAVATFATLFLLCKPISEKLERIRIKYGMMETAPQREETL